MGCFIIESWKIHKNHKINGWENEIVLCNDSTINKNNVQLIYYPLMQNEFNCMI
jgi:hypothetical protein